MRDNFLDARIEDYSKGEIALRAAAEKTGALAYMRSEGLIFRHAPWRIVTTHTACRSSSIS